MYVVKFSIMYQFNLQDCVADASDFMRGNFIVIDEILSLNQGYSFIHLSFHSFIHSLCLCLSFVSLQNRMIYIISKEITEHYSK